MNDQKIVHLRVEFYNIQLIVKFHQKSIEVLCYNEPWERFKIQQNTATVGKVHV